MGTLDGKRSPSAVELIDLESANVIASFDSEAQALAFVREAIARHGETYVYSWALGRIDRSVPPMNGAELVRRASNKAVSQEGHRGKWSLISQDYSPS